jgi:methyltransferase-like protein 6
MNHTNHILLFLNRNTVLIYTTIGHVQSGQYLWPAAAFLADYLITHWDTLKRESVVELGAGVGLAGILTSMLPGTKRAVLTDYDRGALTLIEENISLNKRQESNSSMSNCCDIKAEFLEWGDDASGRNVMRALAEVETPFELVIGTDLLYSKDIVEPLFKSAKQLLASNNDMQEDRLFILTSSFDPGKVTIALI